MIKGLLGKKIGQSQIFAEDGKRIAVTLIKAGPCFVTQIKDKDKDGYRAIQLGFDEAKKSNTPKPLRGIYEKAGLKKTPRFLVEVRAEQTANDSNGELELGQEITVDQVFQVGDKVKISGTSKGKGFTGVVKRWGFRGGPRTHGQSDRERAPGSIGQTTTPGRVFKGKKMAGRAGGNRVTLQGLQVVDIDEKKNLLVVSGLVPGSKGGLLEIYKNG